MLDCPPYDPPECVVAADRMLGKGQLVVILPDPQWKAGVVDHTIPGPAVIGMKVQLRVKLGYRILPKPKRAVILANAVRTLHHHIHGS